LYLDAGKKKLKEMMKSYLRNSSIVDFVEAYFNIRIQDKKIEIRDIRDLQSWACKDGFIQSICSTSYSLTAHPVK